MEGVAFFAGLLTGGVMVWLLAASRTWVRGVRADARIALLEAQVEREQRSTQQQKRSREEAQVAFKGLAADALRQNNQSFLDLAKALFEREQERSGGELERRQRSIEYLVEGMSDSLQGVDDQVREMEGTRREAYVGLHEQVRSLMESQARLEAETGKLAGALRTPRVKGRWGELQLRRVVELAGMNEHCDFTEQVSAPSGNGGRRVPDMIVRLPGERSVVVDAKAPLEALLNDKADVGSRKFGRTVRDHVRRLGAKSYWDRFEEAPEFVVLFLPGEHLFSRALEGDPELIEFGAKHRVILATPTTLIALLRAVGFGWRQEKVARSAKEVARLGRELHTRMLKMTSHLGTLGRGLGRSVADYNRLVGAIESRVIPAARRLEELGASSDEVVTEPERVDQAVREVRP